MNSSGWLQLALYVGLLLLITKPLGIYLFQVLDGKNTFLEPVLGPVERFTYRLLRVDARREHSWKQYAAAMLLFSPGDDGVHLRRAAFAGFPTLSRDDRRPVQQDAADAGPGVSTRRRVSRRTHELAGLLRREHDELFLADGRAGEPQFLGRRRWGSPWRRRWCGASRGTRAARWATSGSIWCGCIITCCCRSVCSTRCSWFRRASRRTSTSTTRHNSPRSRRSRCPRRTRATTRSRTAAGNVVLQDQAVETQSIVEGPHRLADRHQDARHERRVGSSTRTRRTRSRTRRRCPTSCRCSRSLRSRAR